MVYIIIYTIISGKSIERESIAEGIVIAISKLAPCNDEISCHAVSVIPFCMAALRMMDRARAIPSESC
jgi:hypothetical protein